MAHDYSDDQLVWKSERERIDREESEPEREERVARAREAPGASGSKITIPGSPEHRDAVELQEAKDRHRRQVARLLGIALYADGVTLAEVEARVGDAKNAHDGWIAARLAAADETETNPKEEP